MKKIIVTSFIACAAISNSFAKEINCPTADGLRHEWSLPQIMHFEKTEREVIFYQFPHQYGTDTIWYVNIAVKDTDVGSAAKKASQAVNSAYFVSGGMSPWGFYSCGYRAPNGQMIYAYANVED